MKKLYFLFFLLATSLFSQAQNTYGPYKPLEMWGNTDLEYTVETSESFGSFSPLFAPQFEASKCTYYEDYVKLIFTTTQSFLSLQRTSDRVYYETVDFFWDVNDLRIEVEDGYDYRVTDRNTRETIFQLNVLPEAVVEPDSMYFNSIHVAPQAHMSMYEDTLVICSYISELMSMLRFKVDVNGGDAQLNDQNTNSSYLNYTFEHIRGGAVISNWVKTEDVKDGDQLKMSIGTDYYATNYCIQPKVLTRTYNVKIDTAYREPMPIIALDTLLCPGEEIEISYNGPGIFKRWHARNLFTNEYIDTYKIDTIELTQPAIIVAEAYNVGKEVTCPYYSDTIFVRPEDCGYALIRGTVYQDNDLDKRLDYNEPIIANRSVFTLGGEVTLTDNNGNYDLIVPLTGEQVIFPYVESDEVPLDSVKIDFTNEEWPMLETDLRIASNRNDAFGVQMSSSRMRPGFEGTIEVSVLNLKSSSGYGYNTITIDPRLEILGNSLGLTATDNEITWSPYLWRYSSNKLLINVKVPADVNLLGEELVNTVKLIYADGYPENDEVTNRVIVTGSYDPNDKLIFGDSGNVAIPIRDTTVLEYTIRFQNTGSDTAFTVRIEDQISDLLDIRSIEMLDASHDYKLTVKDNNTLVWLFEDILLVDSTTNEPESHGFVKFKIKQANGNSVGTVIPNDAGIYFDFNPPVITNEPQVVVGEDYIYQKIVLSNASIEHRVELKVYPNPATFEVTFTKAGELKVYNALGEVQYSGASANLQLGSWQKGVYYFELQSEGETFRGSFVKQ